MKTLKAGIASYEDMNARTRRSPGASCAPSPEIQGLVHLARELARVLLSRNPALLAYIADMHGPISAT